MKEWNHKQIKEQIKSFPPEARKRAIRMAQEHRTGYPSRWAAIEREVKELRRANEILKLASASLATA